MDTDASTTTTLVSPEVTLVPLTRAHATHIPSLVDAELWAGMSSPIPDSLTAAEAYVERLTCRSDATPFAVTDTRTGEFRGCTAFYEHVPEQGRVEVGHTFYRREHWGGPTNPWCKLLMLEHAFGVLGVHRVALRCDVRNLRSAAAILRLGGVFEGNLRGHRVAADGSRSDSSYYSILSDEWPAVRRRLDGRVRRSRDTTGGTGLQDPRVGPTRHEEFA